MSKALQNIRREYGKKQLLKKALNADPIIQFQRWLDEASLDEETIDPTAFVLATVDENGLPDTRVLLLKDLEAEGFIFYTNYQSHKAEQLTQQPKAAMNFYWAQQSRQVRVRGTIKKTPRELSETYFKKRPHLSQLAALASEQSQVIPNRDTLEKAMQDLQIQYSEDATIDCPENWGGYQLMPNEIEFWQGGDHRLHDRFRYLRSDKDWCIERLAP